MLQSERMNQTQADHEWLSTMLDGELDEDAHRRAVKRLVEDPDLARRWSEYCLIGDALRGQASAQPGLHGRILEALEAEPTLLAPMKPRATARPIVWVAAAASVVAVTWTIWSALPRQETPVQVAGSPEASIVQASQITPYLDAHQDFAQGVVAHPEMHYTRVTLASVEGGR